MAAPLSRPEVTQGPVPRGGRQPFIEISAPRRDPSAGGQLNQAVMRLGETVQATAMSTAGVFQSLAASRQKAQDQLALTKATLAADRAIGELRIGLERSTDWQSMETGWEQGVAEIRERAGEGMNPRVARAFRDRFEATVTSQGIEVRRRALQLEQGEAVATLGEGLRARARAAAAAGNPAALLTEVDKGRADIKGFVDVGYVTPAKAIELERQFLAGVDEHLALAAIDANPEEAVQALIRGDLANLDVARSDALLERANHAADRLLAERRRQAEDAERRTKEQLKAEGDAALTEAWRLHGRGELTRDHIDGIRAKIAPSEYRALQLAIEPKSADFGTDNATYARVWDTMLFNPAMAQRQARDAFANGLLSRADLAAFNNEAQQRIETSGRATPTAFDWAVKKIEAAFGRTGPFAALDEGRVQREYAALRDLHNLATGLDRNDTKIDAIADDLIRRHGGTLNTELPRLVYAPTPLLESITAAADIQPAVDYLENYFAALQERRAQIGEAAYAAEARSVLALIRAAEGRRPLLTNQPRPR